MSSNTSLLRKADIAIADLQTNGGELSPEHDCPFEPKPAAQDARRLGQAIAFPGKGLRRVEFSGSIRTAKLTDIPRLAGTGPPLWRVFGV